MLYHNFKMPHPFASASAAGHISCVPHLALDGGVEQMMVHIGALPFTACAHA